MTQQIIDFVTAHWAVALTLVLGGWVGNSLSTMAVSAITKLKGGPFWVLVKFAHGILDKVDPHTESAAKKAALISVVALALTGCGGTIHTQIEKVIVFEQQVHTYQMQLQGVAEAAIVMLPIEKQQAARETLVDATEKLSLALDAKDAALQAALDASDTANLNVNQLVADIVSAVNAVVAVVNSFGANARQTQAIGARLIVAQTRAMAR